MYTPASQPATNAGPPTGPSIDVLLAASFVQTKAALHDLSQIGEAIVARECAGAPTNVSFPDDPDISVRKDWCKGALVRATDGVIHALLDEPYDAALDCYYIQTAAGSDPALRMSINTANVLAATQDFIRMAASPSAPLTSMGAAARLRLEFNAAHAVSKMFLTVEGYLPETEMDADTLAQWLGTVWSPIARAVTGVDAARQGRMETARHAVRVRLTDPQSLRPTLNTVASARAPARPPIREDNSCTSLAIAGFACGLVNLPALASMAALALGSQLASPTEQRYRSRSGLMLADVFETEFRALVAALSEGRRDYPTVPWSSITLHAHQATASLPAAVAGGQQLERLVGAAIRAAIKHTVAEAVVAPGGGQGGGGAAMGSGAAPLSPTRAPTPAAPAGPSPNTRLARIEAAVLSLTSGGSPSPAAAPPGAPPPSSLPPPTFSGQPGQPLAPGMWHINPHPGALTPGVRVADQAAFLAAARAQGGSPAAPPSGSHPAGSPNVLPPMHHPHPGAHPGDSSGGAGASGGEDASTRLARLMAGEVSIAFGVSFLVGPDPNSAIAAFKAAPGAAFTALGGNDSRDKLAKYAGIEVLPGPAASAVPAMAMCFDTLRPRLGNLWVLPQTQPRDWDEAMQRLMSFAAAASIAKLGSNAAVDRGPGAIQRLESLRPLTDPAKQAAAAANACRAHVVEPLCRPQVFQHEAAVLQSGCAAGLTAPGEARRLVDAHGMPALAYHYGSGHELDGKIATRELGDGKQASATIPFSISASHGSVREWVGKEVAKYHGLGRTEHKTIGPPLQQKIAAFAHKLCAGEVTIVSAVELLGGEEASGASLVDSAVGMEHGNGRYGSTDTKSSGFFADLRKALPRLEALIAVVFGVIAAGSLENGAFGLACRSSTSPASSEGFLGECLGLWQELRVTALEYFCTVLQRQVAAIRRGDRVEPPSLVAAVAEARLLTERNLQPMTRARELQQVDQVATQKALQDMVKAELAKQGGASKTSRWGAPVAGAPAPAAAAPIAAPPTPPKGILKFAGQPQVFAPAAAPAAAATTATAQLAAVAAAVAGAPAAAGGARGPKGIHPHPSSLSASALIVVEAIRSATGDWKKTSIAKDQLGSLNDACAAYNAIALRALGVDKDAAHPPTAVCPFVALLGSCRGIKPHNAPPGTPNKPCTKCEQQASWQRQKLKPIVNIVKAAATTKTAPLLKGDG